MGTSTSLYRLTREPWVRKAKALLAEEADRYAIVRYEGEDEEGEAVVASEGEAAIAQAQEGVPGIYNILDADTGEVIRTCRINTAGGRIIGQGRLAPRDDLARREQRLVEGHERYNLLVRSDLQEAQKEIRDLRDRLDKEKDARRELETKLALAEAEDGMGGWAAIADKVFTLFATDALQDKLLARFQLMMGSLTEEQQEFAESLFNSAMAIPDEEVEAAVKRAKDGAAAAAKH